jgi:hypothetical protein
MCPKESFIKPRGVVEDVLVQIDKFYYPVDFLILDTESVVHVNEVTTRSGKNVDTPHIKEQEKNNDNVDLSTTSEPVTRPISLLFS